MVLQCKLEIGAEDYYSCDLTRKHPVRVTIVTINGDTGFGISESLDDGDENDIKDYIKGLRKSSSILEVQIMYKSAEAYWTRVVHKLPSQSIYETVLQSGCMTQLPITIQRGMQYHTVLSPTRKMLSSLLHNLRLRFSTVNIRRLLSKPIASYQAVLTKKQENAFRLALNSGYYEIPRKITINDLCVELGIKRVAMQERLRRAELRIFREFAEELL